MDLKRSENIALFLGLLMVFFVGTVQADNVGETGKIAGRIVDSQNGEPLPGANVTIMGTTLGAATDLQGYYTIIKVPPGTYTVSAKMIGYKEVRQTDVRVRVDLTAKINFNLETSAIETDAVTIVAERPLVVRDNTSSSTRVNSEEIEDIPNVTSVTDAIQLMPGVVGEGEELHMRGGRSGEVVYMVDGVAVNDPLFNSEIVSVNKYSVQEIEMLSGGYNAEYGNAQSGVVNIVTRTGGARLSGRIAHFTDHLIGSGRYPSDILTGADNPLDVLSTDYLYLKGPGIRSNSFNTDRTEFSLGGPEPITNLIFPYLGFNGLKNKISFYVSGTAEMTDGYLPNEDQGAPLDYYREVFDDPSAVEVGEAGSVDFIDAAGNVFEDTAPGFFTSNSPFKKAHPFLMDFFGLSDWGGRFYNNLNYSARVSYRVSNQINTSLSYTGSQFWQDTYNHATWKWHPERTAMIAGRNSSIVLNWNHTLNAKSFYQVKMGLLDNYRYTWSGMRNGIPLTPEFMNGRIFDGSDAAQFGTDAGGDPDELDPIDSADELAGRQDPRSGFIKTGYGDDWSRHFTKTFTLKIDYLSQLNRNNEVKAGVEWKYNDLEQQQINAGDNKVPSRRDAPPDDGPYITSGSIRDFYSRYPNTGSAYIQDKVEFESLIINAGLRFDRFDPGAQVFETGEAFLTTDTEKKRVNTKNYLSPRLGLSHPITDRSRLYFFYGRFIQMPTLRELYRRQNRFRVFQNQLNIFGNPDLEAEETISYEVGFDQQLTDDLKFGVTGFFKDIRNQINSEVFGPDAAPFRKIVNKDFGNDRGFEFDLVKRFSNYYAANINYTLMWATTRSSTVNLGAVTGGAPFSNINEVPASWDQRHTINANVRFELPAGRGVNVFGQEIDRASLTLFWRYGSGLPFTVDADVDPNAKTNAERLPYFSELDLRFRKDFKLIGNTFATFYLDINNVLNRRNVIFLRADEDHRCIECDITDPISGDVETKTFPNGNPEGNGTGVDLDPQQFGPPRQILLGFGLRF